MHRKFKSIISALAALMLLAGLYLPTARAQQVATVSIAPLDRLLGDVKYLLGAANVPELGGMALMMAKQATNGLDTTRPAGVSVMLEGQMPSVLVFLPLKDRATFFSALASMAIEPDDLGNGVYEVIFNGPPIYLKDGGNWLFVGQTEDSFGDLPSDPSAALGTLPQRYDIAVSLDLQALPSDLKEMLLAQMRAGFERGMEEQRGQSDEERAAARRIGEQSIAQIERLLSETEKFILGWAAEPSNQRTFLDTGAMFIPGSELANQVEASKSLTSDFAGLASSDAAIRLQASSFIPETDRELAKGNLQNAISQIKSALDQNSNMPEEAKDLILEFAKGMIRVTEKTIDDGKMDVGASVHLGESSMTAIMGSSIGDGSELANELKKFVAGLPQAAEVPTVKFDYAKHGDYSLHQMTVPVKIADPKAKEIFGDSLNIVVATADKSFLISYEPSGDSQIRSAIDRLGSNRGGKATPFHLAIEVGQILKFAQSIDSHPALDVAINAIVKYAGKDRVELTGSIIERGAVYRLSIDEGVLKAIGSAAKAGNGGGF
ncbi:MAG: hypothetical protein KDB03_15555 [Planctomycetales bacterium]|nr:hypothetical protein [Planctomycetales bacterium]